MGDERMKIAELGNVFLRITARAVLTSMETEGIGFTKAVEPYTKLTEEQKQMLCTLEEFQGR
jgi:hypothetical protein